MRWRHRHRGLPVVPELPELPEQLLPVPIKNPAPLELSKEELAVLMLVDYFNLTQLEAAERLLCPRSRISRLLKSARKKLLQALLEGRPIKIIK
ncbi:MAG: DUF134 domain-containing protein [bacterium]|nr:DUF134 domain-containing protein [bacterium]